VSEGFIEQVGVGTIFGFGSGMVGYARSTNNAQLFFWTEDILLCEAHAPESWLPMQPYTTYDREQGYGKRGCPFCRGGELYKQEFRSLKAFEAALDTLKQTPYAPPAPPPELTKELVEAKFRPVDKLLEFMHDRVVVNLFLTEQCNFECGHCFYAASPRSPKGYMKKEMLDKIRHFVLTLREKYHANVDVNLIGGEPTLNLKEFKRCLDHVMDWRDDTRMGSIEFEMTTNGWWLSKAKWTLEFFEAILPHCESDFGEGLTVRVSDDNYHMEWRVGYLKDRRAKPALDSLLENGTIDDEPVFWAQYVNCYECAHEMLDGEWPGKCPKCGCEEMDYGRDEYLLSRQLPEVQEGQPWIYAEQPDIQRISLYDKGRSVGDSWVVPSNDNCDWGGNDKGESKYCHNGVHQMTFDPKGIHRDGCCSGSDMQFSTIGDDPLVVLGLNNTFTKEYRPTCQGCRSGATDFQEGEFIKLARYFYEEVADSMQLLEAEDNDTGENIYRWWEPWMASDEVMEATAEEVGDNNW
jgi:hypothetical protein